MQATMLIGFFFPSLLFSGGICNSSCQLLFIFDLRFQFHGFIFIGININKLKREEIVLTGNYEFKISHFCMSRSFVDINAQKY